MGSGAGSELAPRHVVVVLLRTVVYKGVQAAVGASMSSLVAELAPNPVVVVMGLAVVFAVVTVPALASMAPDRHTHSTPIPGTISLKTLSTPRWSDHTY